MNTKKTLLILMAALIMAAPAIDSAWAAPRGGYHHPGYANNAGYGWQHPAVSPEQQAAYEKIMTDYYTKSQPMRNDIWAKQAELEYLSRSGNADPKAISKMVGEMKVLREKCQALHDSTAANMAKSLSISNDHAYSLLRAGCGMGGGCAMNGGMGKGSRGGARGGYHHGGYGYHNGGYGYHNGGYGYYQQPAAQ